MGNQIFTTEGTENTEKNLISVLSVVSDLCAGHPESG